MRITAACPESLVYAGNQLAMCLAYGPADGETYRLPCGYVDANNNLYSAASWVASEEWIQFAQQPLVRPSWDTEEIIDMAAANLAQSKLVFSDVPELANPDTLLAVVGEDGPAILIAMGLSVVETPTEE